VEIGVICKYLIFRNCCTSSRPTTIYCFSSVYAR